MQDASHRPDGNATPSSSRGDSDGPLARLRAWFHSTFGADETRLEIWADPGLRRNTHAIEVESDSANFSMTIENLPSAENPRTGRITALSVIATLRGLVAPLRVGT